MPETPAIAAHYTGPLADGDELTQKILNALNILGVDLNAITPADLKPVDEFHIGGVEATQALLAQLPLAPGVKLLDLGCGLGGTARHAAAAFGAQVEGVDLTPAYIAAAQALTAKVGLAEKIRFHVGDATDPPVAPESADIVTLLHVGMNIPDKSALCAAAFNRLRPGGTFAVYDVMRVGDENSGAIAFPVPWASAPEMSHLARPEDYRAAAETAGFTLAATRNRRDFALEFFSRLAARVAEHGPPPLGVNLLMGETASLKLQNMVAALKSGAIAPVEMILTKP